MSTLTLNVIVVGAGIGGLAAANSLRRAGAFVTVLERASAVYEIGAGIGLGPNAVGALTALGVAGRLAPSVATPLVTTRRRWQDGSDLFAASLEPAPEFYGYPFWFAHRGDVQKALLDSATGIGGPGTPVDVRLATPVVGVDPTDGSVTTASGERCHADLVVAADGINSVVRSALLGGEPAVYSGHSGFRTQVDVDTLRDPEARDLVARQGFESWLGPHIHIVYAPFRRGRMINVTACIEADRIEGIETSAPVPTSELLDRLDGWHSSLRRLVAAGNGVRRYDIYVRPPITQWAYGRVCLLGDAAHPMLPYLGQGAAQAIEDGEALGAVLLGTDATDVPAALADFESLRVERANRAQSLSAENAVTFHLPDGPSQRERDAAIGRGAIDSDVTRWLWQYQDPSIRRHAVPSSIPKEIADV